MQALTGTDCPFCPASATLVEYRPDGSRRQVETPAVAVLCDDSVAEIGSKLARISGASVVGWWIRAFVSAKTVQRAVRECGRKVLTAMLPEAEYGPAQRTSLMSRGGVVHVSPYQKVVFNISVQMATNSLPRTLSRYHTPNRPDALTDVLEVHFMCLDSSYASTLGSPMTERILLSHPQTWPANVRLGAVHVSNLHMHVSAKGHVLTDDLFVATKLEGDATMVARVGENITPGARVLKAAVRDGVFSPALVSNMLSQPSNDNTSVLLVFGGDAFARIESTGSITVSTLRVISLDEIQKIWAMAQNVLITALNLTLNTDFHVLRFSLSIPIHVPRRFAVSELVGLLRSKYSDYVDAALADDGSLDAVYIRTSGVRRQPRSVENLLIKHTSGEWSRAQLSAKLKTLMLDDTAVNVAIERFNPKELKHPPPASIRLSNRDGTSVYMSGTHVIDAQRLLLIICHAITNPLQIEADSHSLVGPAEDMDIHDILNAAQGLHSGETRPEPPTDPPGDSGAVGSDLIGEDPALFNFKAKDKNTYARQCTRRRQPIAVTDAEIAKMGFAAPEYVRSGADNKAYMCPEVWCKSARIGMSLADAEEANWTCPDGERAEVLRGEFHHAGFLDPTKHPTGMCMPCCFKHVGPMLVDRIQACSASAQAQDEQTANLRYVMGPASVPLPAGRFGRLALGSGRVLDGVLRQGVDQKQHTFFMCVAAIEHRPLSDIIHQVQNRLHPDTVAALADGALYQYLMADYPLDAHSEDSKSKFLEYTRTNVGAERLVRRGMASCFKTIRDVDCNNPDVLREVLIAHVYQCVHQLVDDGNNHATSVFQFLSVACLNRRYPIMSSSGQVDIVSCTRFAGGGAAPVAGILVRDGRFLEPLVQVPNHLVNMVSQRVAEACGPQASGQNQDMLDVLHQHGLHEEAVLVDEGHVVVGVVVTGSLALPLPERVPPAWDLPVMYVNSAPEADPQWSKAAVGTLIRDISKKVRSVQFSDVSINSHCVCVGDFVIPLQGGKACLSNIASSTGALNLLRASTGQSSLHAYPAYQRLLNAVTDKLMERNDHAFVAISHPLSPLTRVQKQALFEEVLQDTKLGDIRYSDIMQGQREREVQARPGELYVTSDDVASGLANLALNRIARGMEGAFASTRAVIHAATNECELDKHVDTPIALQHLHVKGLASSQGSIVALACASILMGCMYTPQHHASLVARRAVSHWNMTMAVPTDWPQRLRSVIAKAAQDATETSPAWQLLKRHALEQPVQVHDLQRAFSIWPASVVVYAHDGSILLKHSVPGSAWRVVAWLDADNDLVFGARGGHIHIPNMHKH